ncbi:magnesium/cobalt transporter CorA [candidate division KSB1 bacterium]|nr:magnesium/cobalt transporter CorA [candidate division KSB1 bacterium]
MDISKIRINKAKRKKHRKPGMPPGTLVHVGEKKVEKVRIRVMDYDDSGLSENELDSIEDTFPYRDKSSVTWINIDGLHVVDNIQKIGSHFEIHPLVLEDILNTGHRPKMEDNEDYIYIVLKMLYYQPDNNNLEVEQISIILGENYVITFQEREGDVFNPVRERIRTGKIRTLKRKSDYLAYALVDAVVDNYFLILERMGESIEDLEEELLQDPGQRTLKQIYSLKNKMLLIRKSIWPLREAISALERGDSPLIRESTHIYLNDVYDHTIQVIDTMETYRDMVSGMLDTYLSIVSNRMNEIMKVLTIIATIFIPLTFIAGIYGMNFQYMPELKSHYGYFAVWTVMIAIAVVMVLFFKRKKWL